MRWLARLKAFLGWHSVGMPQEVQPSDSPAKSVGEAHSIGDHDSIDESHTAAASGVVLYTRSGCHLCDEAKKVLEACLDPCDLPVVEVDIDSDSALKAAYDCCVPVVEIDGKVRFRGQVNEVLLRRLLRGRRG